MIVLVSCDVSFCMCCLSPQSMLCVRWEEGSLSQAILASIPPNVCMNTVTRPCMQECRMLPTLGQMIHYPLCMVLSVRSGLVLGPDYVKMGKGSNVTAINFIPQCVHVYIDKAMQRLGHITTLWF